MIQRGRISNDPDYSEPEIASPENSGAARVLDYGSAPLIDFDPRVLVRLAIGAALLSIGMLAELTFAHTRIHSSSPLDATAVELLRTFDAITGHLRALVPAGMWLITSHDRARENLPSASIFNIAIRTLAIVAFAFSSFGDHLYWIIRSWTLELYTVEICSLAAYVLLGIRLHNIARRLNSEALENAAKFAMTGLVGLIAITRLAPELFMLPPIPLGLILLLQISACGYAAWVLLKFAKSLNRAAITARGEPAGS